VVAVKLHTKITGRLLQQRVVYLNDQEREAEQKYLLPGQAGDKEIEFNPSEIQPSSFFL